MPHVFLDFEFDSVPMINIENPTTNAILFLSSQVKLEVMNMIICLFTPKKKQYMFLDHKGKHDL